MNQVLREIVADTLERLADGDERLRMVTVTAVECDGDLRHAVVYLASMSDEAAEALAGHRPQLQQAIGRQARMKRTPQLAFASDPAVAHGGRVEEILRRIHHRGEGAAGEGAAGEGAAGDRAAGEDGPKRPGRGQLGAGARDDAGIT